MKTKATYKFIEFIRPDGYWPLPYTLEQAFGVFAWMLSTGDGYHDDGRWGRHDIRSLLSCQPTCCNFSQVRPIGNVADLQRRFHHAILSGYVGPRLQEWRETFGVTPSGKAIISFPHHGLRGYETSEHGIARGVDALLGAKGRIGVQLNQYHSRAREINGVSLHWHNRYWFVLNYGCDGSEWQWTLAKQLPGEAFYTTLRRAQKHLASLVDGKKVREVA